MIKISGTLIIIFLLAACTSNQMRPVTNNASNNIQSISASITNNCNALLSVHVSPNSNCQQLNSCDVTVHFKYKGDTRNNCQMRYSISTICGNSNKSNVRSYNATREVKGKRDSVQYITVDCY